MNPYQSQQHCMQSKRKPQNLKQFSSHHQQRRNQKVLDHHHQQSSHLSSSSQQQQLSQADDFKSSTKQKLLQLSSNKKTIGKSLKIQSIQTTPQAAIVINPKTNKKKKSKSDFQQMDLYEAKSKLNYQASHTDPNPNSNSKFDQRPPEFYAYHIGQHIANRYQILSAIDRGSFGDVVKVHDHKTNEKLALKILKQSKQLQKQFFVQISILTHIRGADPSNTSGIVRINDFFIHKNHICILFELLAINLYQLLESNHFRPLSQDIVRIFAMQILNSLNFLRREKIVHCDIKPQNIVLNKKNKAGIKLIDFGTSCFDGSQLYTYLQSRYYRAPEVMAEMPYSFPIDMWSFGCVLAELITGQPLFKAEGKVEQMMQISSAIGMPSKDEGLYSLAMLNTEPFKKLIAVSKPSDLEKAGKFNEKYLKPLDERIGPFLRHNSAEKTGTQKVTKSSTLTTSSFLSFLKCILKWQPFKRLTPEQALTHPWITKGLSGEMQSIYSSLSTIQNNGCVGINMNRKSVQGQSTKRKKSKQEKIIFPKNSHSQTQNRKASKQSSLNSKHSTNNGGTDKKRSKSKKMTVNKKPCSKGNSQVGHKNEVHQSVMLSGTKHRVKNQSGDYCSTGKTNRSKRSKQIGQQKKSSRANHPNSSHKRQNSTSTNKNKIRFQNSESDGKHTKRYSILEPESNQPFFGNDADHFSKPIKTGKQKHSTSKNTNVRQNQQPSQKTPSYHMSSRHKHHLSSQQFLSSSKRSPDQKTKSPGLKMNKMTSIGQTKKR